MGQALDGNPGLSGLLRWGGADISAEAETAKMIADPRFGAAARALASNMLAAGAQDKALDGIFKDAGRYLAALWAVYLHFSGGLTLPRLKQLCASSGFLSPGRARALLLYMRYLRYIEPLPAGGDPPGYTPTRNFMAAWQIHIAAALSAVQPIEPAIAGVVERLGTPEILASFARIQGESLLDSARAVDQDMAVVARVFLHRHAGSQLVWALLTAETGAVFPPSEPIPFSVSAVARRFGVSRIHIRRMLSEAETEGLLCHRKDGSVIIAPIGRTQIAILYASQLVQLLIAAARTIGEHPEIWHAQQPPLVEAGQDRQSSGGAAIHPAQDRSMKDVA